MNPGRRCGSAVKKTLRWTIEVLRADPSLEKEHHTLLWPTDAHPEAAASLCRGRDADQNEAEHKNRSAGAYSWRICNRNLGYFFDWIQGGSSAKEKSWNRRI